MTDQRYPWGRTFVVGFGFLGISVIWPLFNSLIPPMLEDLGLSSLVVGFILTWDNIINMFVQPWVGAQSDRTNSRFGRRKPWILLGAPLAAVFFCLVPFVRTHAFGIALAILATNLGMALFRSPTIAFLGDLFKPQQRSRANGVINLMGGVGGALALFAGGALYKLSVPLPFIAGSLVMLLALGIVILFVREPKSPSSAGADAPGSASDTSSLWLSLTDLSRRPHRQGLYLLLAIFCWFVGWNAMEAFFTIYARSVLGLSVGAGTQMLTAFAATLIVFAIPSGLIATKFGRRRTILVGLAGMLIGLVVGFGVRQPLPLLITLGAMGACRALVNINSLPMVYDLGGADKVGSLTGLYYFWSSAAAISGPILAGLVIDVAGHRALWIFSACFMALAVLFMGLFTSRAIPASDPSTQELLSRSG